jgi:hypothetical protein
VCERGYGKVFKGSKWSLRFEPGRLLFCRTGGEQWLPGKDKIKHKKKIAATLTHVDIALIRIYDTSIPEK